MAGSGELSPNQRRLMVALIGGSTSLREAAKTARIGERTAWRWVHENNGFRHALHGLFDRVTAEAVEKAVVGMISALDTLQEIHADKDAPTAVRVSAARAVLDVANDLRELGDLAERVRAIETRLGAMQS